MHNVIFLRSLVTFCERFNFKSSLSLEKTETKIGWPILELIMKNHDNSFIADWAKIGYPCSPLFFNCPWRWQNRHRVCCIRMQNNDVGCFHVSIGSNWINNDHPSLFNIGKLLALSLIMPQMCFQYCGCSMWTIADKPICIEYLFHWPIGYLFDDDKITLLNY